MFSAMALKKCQVLVLCSYTTKNLKKVLKVKKQGIHEYFFYTTRESDAAKYYLEQLRELPVLKQMTSFSAGSLFHSPLALKLRSGDLLLLYATNKEELNDLLTLQKEFVDFRIILILADSAILRTAYSLQPRFIAFQDEKLTKLEAVIKKFKGRKHA